MIYFLFNDDDLVYIGKTIDIQRRLKQHRDKVFNSYAYLPMDREIMDLI